MLLSAGGGTGVLCRGDGNKECHNLTTMASPQLKILIMKESLKQPSASIMIVIANITYGSFSYCVQHKSTKKDFIVKI